MSLYEKFNIVDHIPETCVDVPAFTVTRSRGFLPRLDPPATLPFQFRSLEALLERMPVTTASGEPGLLAQFKLGEAVLKTLPDLTSAVEQYRHDAVIINALYRDYSFLASAYLLEPCHERFLAGKDYGLARDVLPRNIARPIAKAAEIIGFKPFMEYAGSYALFNYRLERPELGLEYDNLRLIRAFERGLDPSSSEAGFVLVHVAMVKHSGQLVSGVVDSLESCSRGDMDRLEASMRSTLNAMKAVNKVMDTMWSRSKPGSYTSFRTFIFGITSQTMFPKGVLYEGVSDEPKSFRGESGANDSMIPLLDNLLQIKMPATPLTDILHDFRTYRPGNHREFLEAVCDVSKDVAFAPTALSQRNTGKLYVELLDQVREFRWRHWCFTREYILKQTKYGRATGGSPIVTWLPNQLQAVLEAINAAASPWQDDKDLEKILTRANEQEISLRKDVGKYCLDRAD